MSDQNPQASKILLHRNRQDGANFDLYSEGDVPIAYQDGICNIGIGDAVSRLNFFRVRNISRLPDGQPLEERQVDMCVIMPTAQLLEALAGLLGRLVNDKENILSALEERRRGIDKILSAVQISDAS